MCLLTAQTRVAVFEPCALMFESYHQYVRERSNYYETLTYACLAVDPLAAIWKILGPKVGIGGVTSARNDLRPLLHLVTKFVISDVHETLTIQVETVVGVVIHRPFLTMLFCEPQGTFHAYLESRLGRV